MRHSPFRLVLLGCVIALVVLPAVVPADVSADPATRIDDTLSVTLESWLTLGPEPWPLPAIDGYGLGDALDEESIDLEGLWPTAGEGYVLRPGGRPARWIAADGAAPWASSALADGTPYKAWATTYLEVDFFTAAELKVRSEHPVRVLLDGVEVASRKSSIETTDGDKADPDADLLTADLNLSPGKHLLFLTSMRDPDSDADWSLTAEMTGAEPWTGLDVSTSPRRHVGLTELLDQETVRGLDMSPDGRYLRIQWSNVAVPADHRISWSHLLDVETGTIVRELRTDVSGFSWSPDGTSYAWAGPTGEPDSDGYDLWISPVAGGASRRVLKNLENWVGHQWLPDGSGLILQTMESSEADDRGFKRFRGPNDRWVGNRDTTQLWWLAAEGGTLRRLSLAGSDETLADVGIDRLLLLRQQYGTTERPFYRTSLHELNLATLERRELASEDLLEGWVDSVVYLDPLAAGETEAGRRLLVRGSAQLFDGAGRDPDLAADVVVNDYETEAYFFDPASGEATSLTRDWDPTVNQLVSAGGALWIVGQDRSYQRLYRYDLAADTFTEVPSGSDRISQVQLSRDASTVAYIGEGPSSPEAVFVRSTAEGGEPRQLVRAGDEAWKRVDLGRVETFSFVMDEGTEQATEILGRVNYPPNFDPSKKYPLIVSYYGGTVPSDRAFGGRYPRSYWAAHGFVVYTVQPSGATGFGQEFSARHVNAWGRRTADEILEGTERFLDAHPFVDRDKVGCIGASYGGFMTMYLVSHSDLFSAAVSHAGISNLASYWGKGWWGYLYSAAASADSFPWNARDLYIDQSPLYAADQIHTPLLLLHGDHDTNVPPVESHQMYTALKVLGRDVELIEVGGEDHQIFYYPKRKLWMETIVAYFTKYLHDRPEWWVELWGTAEEPKG